MKRIEVMITAFRDGFQSCVGARVLTDDFLPAVEAAVEAGFTHFEAGGGARYQVPYLYCGEDAFDMMDAFRTTTGPDANLQTLSRGVNVVGLDSQSSDIIDLHARMFAKHGMTTIRNFDALNDVRNLAYSGRSIVEAGLRHEVVVTMMALPPGLEGAHDAAFYLRVLDDILDDGVPFTSFCFKDASGTATPRVVHDTIRAARKRLPEGTHLRLHTHDTAGIAVAQYLAALEAGADGIDLCLAPCSGGTAQPDVVVMWHALRGTEFDLGVDIDKVLEAEIVFKDCMKDYFMPPESRAVEPLIAFAPMPGGALTANTQMMRDNGMLDRYPDVIAAMPETVRRGGFGTSVTPVSQFYFQQAFNNAVIGPWKRIAEGYGKMVLGYFGRTPVDPDPEIVALAGEQLGLEPTTRNPREINDEDPTKGVAAATDRLRAANLPVTDENVFIAASLGAKGISFLQGDRPLKIRKNTPPAPTAAAPETNFTVRIEGRSYEVRFEGDDAFVDGERVAYTVGASAEDASAAIGPSSVEVKAPMPGTILSVEAVVGRRVAEGDELLKMEALKMEVPIFAPAAGTVSAVTVKPGDTVVVGAVLVAFA
jgi:pyruvate carboxylase subunit B